MKACQAVANIIAAGYLVGGGFVLVAFLRAPPDGLANIWVALWVAPVTALGLLIDAWLGVGFPFMPSRLGYYGRHVAYFIPAIAICAMALHRVLAGAMTKREPERL